MHAARRRDRVQIAALAIGAAPAALLVVRALAGDLGANPIESVTHATGAWALRLLLLTLAVTPARRLLGWTWLAPVRRTLGLLAFGYASLHFLTFVVLDHFFDWSLIAEDLLERPFISAGFAAFLCLLPLAATSTRAMMRRLGRRWQLLHRLVYLAAVAGVVHYAWGVKADLRGPLLHGAALAGLLGYRLLQRAGVRTRQSSGIRSRS